MTRGAPATAVVFDPPAATTRKLREPVSTLPKAGSAVAVIWYVPGRPIVHWGSLSRSTSPRPGPGVRTVQVAAPKVTPVTRAVPARTSIKSLVPSTTMPLDTGSGGSAFFTRSITTAGGGSGGASG